MTASGWYSSVDHNGRHHGSWCYRDPIPEPACWGWWEYDQRCALSDVPGRLGDEVYPSDLAQLLAWHKGACACCGTTDGGLVCDHDHWSGLVRGYLCIRCNHTEGRAFPEGRIAWYRQRHPARLWGLQIPYERPRRGAT